LPYPPADYHICPCCATEFGNDDAEFSHQQLREMWVAGGANWFFGRAPEQWNPWYQLIESGYVFALPFHNTIRIHEPTQAKRFTHALMQEPNETTTYRVMPV
jgi:hypothetical protein